MGGRGATVQQRLTTTLFQREVGKHDDGTPILGPGISHIGPAAVDTAAKAVGFRDGVHAQATFAKFMRRGVGSISKQDKRRLDRLPPAVRSVMYDGLADTPVAMPKAKVTRSATVAYKKRELIRKQQQKRFGKAPVRKVSKSVFKKQVARAIREPTPYPDMLPSVGTVVRRRVYGPDGRPTLRVEYFTIDS